MGLHKPKPRDAMDSLKPKPRDVMDLLKLRPRSEAEPKLRHQHPSMHSSCKTRISTTRAKLPCSETRARIMISWQSMLVPPNSKMSSSRLLTPFTGTITVKIKAAWPRPLSSHGRELATTLVTTLSGDRTESTQETSTRERSETVGHFQPLAPLLKYQEELMKSLSTLNFLKLVFTP